MKTKIVFWVNLAVLVSIYMLTLFVAAEMLASVGTIIIVMIVGNGATYIGGKRANAWQKSKYWRPELDGR